MKINCIMQTDWNKSHKIKWNYLKIFHPKQVISLPKSEFSCTIRVSSRWTSSTDDCSYIWFDINRCIKYIFLLTKTPHKIFQSSAILFNITWINKSVNRYISWFLLSSSINSSNAVCMIVMYCLTYTSLSFYVNSMTNK
jgi:hypothetical protein